MTDISALLAGWEEARNNLGRKGSVRTIELRTAGQKVADALVDVNARKAAFRLRAERAESALAACLERETQLREAAQFYANVENWTQVTSYGARIFDEESQVIKDYGKRAADALASSVGVGAVATEDGKA